MNPNSDSNNDHDKRSFKPRFTRGRCKQCSWFGHGAKYITGVFICSYCDHNGSSQAAAQQKNWWLKTGRLR